VPGLRALAAAAILAGLPVAAQADHLPVPHEGLAFDDANHRLWYARFWTGHCTGLSFFVCRSGAPYWHETLRRLAAAAPDGRRAALSARLFALGRKIGHEWAKENDVRKISTEHIRVWYALLDGTVDGEAAIARVETEAAALLAKR
jgi:hypothetical protein